MKYRKLLNLLWIFLLTTQIGGASPIALGYDIECIEAILEAHAAKDPRGRFYFDTIPAGETRVSDFVAKSDGENIEVTWNTESEYLLDYFELYQSLDYSEYKPVASIKESDGQKEGSKKQYEILDKSLKELSKKPKKVQYRLKAVSKLGITMTVAQTSLALSGQSGSADDIGDLLPQITPKSPNVAAMERYGSIPVSLYTGQPTIEIPIWDIQVGDMTIPVRLSYHAGGNKVLDNAAWTGLGWSLTGLYSLTREVRGQGDEISGLINKNLPNYPSFIGAGYCLTEALKEELNQHINFNKDVERDIFTYRTPHRSNSFVIDSSNTIQYLESDRTQVTYSPAPSLLDTFTVRDVMGNRYIYREKESTFSNHVSNISTWHMTELYNHVPGQQVKYTYYPLEVLEFTSEITYYETWHTDVCDAPVGMGMQSSTFIPNYTEVRSKSPKEIFFPGGKILFKQASTNRLDGLGKALDSIVVYGYNFTTSNYEVIRKYNLVHSYKDRIDNSGKVLFLDKVEMVDKNGTLIGSYDLAYNSQALPEKTSLAKDHWGYYNGQSNSTLIPPNTWIGQLNCYGSSASYAIGGANRNPDATKMQAWMLTKITFPTRGWSEFTYEPHQYVDLSSNLVTVGGLRIKSVVSKEGGGNTITRRYVYGTNQSGGGKDRDKAKKTIRTDQKIKLVNGSSPPTDYSYNIRTFAAGVNTILNPFESVAVTYAQVTVYEDISGTGSNGRTVYTFKDDANDFLWEHPATSRRALQSQHWNRGQLLNKIVFDKDNQKKVEETHTYQLLVNTPTPTLGYVFGRTEVLINSNLPTSCTYDDRYGPIHSYNWQTGLLRKIRTETKSYDDLSPGNFVLKKTETDYHSTYFQPTETRSFNTDGDLRINRYRYVTDYSNLSSGHGGPAGALYQMGANNEISTPVETLRLRKASGSSIARLLGGSLQLPRKLTMPDGSTYTVPDSTYLLNIPEDLNLLDNAFALSAVTTGGQVTHDIRYEARMKMDSYNTFGDLLTYHLIADAQHAYTYSVVLNNGVYHHRVNSEVVNSNGTTTYTTTFTQDIPLLGPKKITAPNGLETSYTYDAFGRLSEIKDHSGNLVKVHEYNYASGNNFVRTYLPRVASSSLGTTPASRERIDQYYDGLGRPRYTLHHRANPDIVQSHVYGHTTYDLYGRVEKVTIPFWSLGTNSIAAPGSVHGDTRPYSQVTAYDDSPLNRATVTYGPGTIWFSNQKAINHAYKVAAAGVRKYVLNTSGGANVSGTYGSNTLFQTETMTEQGNKVIEYHDNDGKLIQRSVQESATEYMTTAYIYDAWDRVKLVIQPESFKTSSNFTEGSSYFINGVFAQKYDGRGRTMEQHEPGGGWSRTVYDRLDRPVMTQNDLQSTDTKWSYLRYDALGRTIESGLIHSGALRSTLQGNFDGINTAYEQWNTGNNTYGWVSFPASLQAVATVKARNVYDHYPSLVSNTAFDANHAYHSRYNSGSIFGRGLLTWSFAWDSDQPATSYHQVHYYDNKARLIQTISGHHLGGTDKPVKVSTQYNFAGEVTAAKSTYKMDDLDDITHVDSTGYDHKGRPRTHFGGTNSPTVQICTTQYDDMGRTMRKIYYPGMSFTAGNGVDFIYRPPSPDTLNTEDIARKGIILDAGTEIYVSETPMNTYLADIDPNQGNPTPITNLQTIDYQYNVRSWLTGINLDAQGLAKPNLNQGDLFSMKLAYESEGRFDGNVAKQWWQVANDDNTQDVIRSYAFSYDHASRLTLATYVGDTGEKYGLRNLTYDKNGNIKSLSRQGKMDNGYGTMDSLQYTYTGNRLMKVEDAISGDHGVDFVNKNTGTNDYTYYGDGCLKQDLNEGISQIDYDLYVGKPRQVTLSSGEWIKYRYAGSGALIRRELSSGEVWDYVGGLLLKNGEPYQLTTAEGTAIREDSTWRPVFEYRDQVGNLRVAFTKRNGSLQKTQTSAYEPFGVPFLQRNLSPVKDPYRYHGHEDTPDFGLRLTLMGARCYNQTIGRFLAHDPLSGAAPGWSGYRFAGDDPVNVTDPTGLYEYTDGYGTWDATTSGVETKVYGIVERPPGQSGDGDERQIIRDSDGKPIVIRIGSPKAKSGPGPGDPILQGHPLYRLIESRQDDIGNWHYYKRGTNEEIQTSESGLDYLLNQAQAFLPNAIGAITKWLNAWKAGRAGEGVTNLIPEGNLANHLFKGAGKLSDNPANRTLIQKISNGKPLGVDAYGKSWYTGVDAAGKSIYSYTQNGVVKGAGYMNMTPAEMITKYGLK